MIKWAEEGEDSLYLFTVSEFNKLPDGVELECIDGDKKVKGKDVIDLDVRFHHIAWGVRHLLTHPDRNLLLTFVLSQ